MVKLYHRRILLEERPNRRKFYRDKESGSASEEDKTAFESTGNDNLIGSWNVSVVTGVLYEVIWQHIKI